MKKDNRSAVAFREGDVSQSIHEELRELMAAEGTGCISLYMPTHRSGPETREGPGRLKNLLKRAEDEAVALGLRGTEVRAWLAPAAEHLRSTTFWSEQLDGLAVLLAPTLARLYRLPVSVPELVIVADRLHLKPLLPLLEDNGVFHVLAISQKQVRLFQGSRGGLVAWEAPGMPTSMADALWADDPEKSLQHHTSGSRGASPGAAVFHGQGTGQDDQKTNLLRFFQAVDRGVVERLGTGGPPMILACVDYYRPIYREANRYGGLLPRGIGGNPDELSPSAMLAAALEVMQPEFDRECQQHVAELRRLSGSARVASAPLEVVEAARAGRVQSLFVATDQHHWGRIDESQAAIDPVEQRRPGDRDLLDVAAVETLRHGGRVFPRRSSQIPDGAVAAALLRYQWRTVETPR